MFRIIDASARRRTLQPGNDCLETRQRHTVGTWRGMGQPEKAVGLPVDRKKTRTAWNLAPRTLGLTTRPCMTAPPGTRTAGTCVDHPP